MQAVRTLVLQHLRLRAPPSVAARGGGAGPPAVEQRWFAREMSAPADQDGGCSSGSETAVRARVVDLVKKFDKIDADKVSSCLCSARESRTYSNLSVRMVIVHRRQL
jgi:NADH dehydrogenase (ubiquinone) 1 alpha/beta subcomplex 1